MSALSTAFAVYKRAERLVELEEKHRRVLDEHARQLRELTDRVSKLEAREEMMIAEAKGAAASMATTAVSQNLVQIALRVGALEERMRHGRTVEGPPE